MLTVFHAFSQFERDLIAQRTKEGLESARARGRKGGRPKVKDKNIEKALNLYHTKEYSISEIVEMSGISQATLYRYIRKKENNRESKIAEINMSLRVENNSKFVRGKNKVREKIEQYLKFNYQMKYNPSAGEYVIYVSYVTVESLEKTVNDILREMYHEADLKNCFIEVDAHCDS